MTSPERTRRHFLQASGTALGGAWLALHLPSVEAAAALARLDAREGRPFGVLTPEEARELEAVAEQILPGGDDGPGARDAGVIHFLDRAFESFAAPMLEGVRAGLGELEEAVRGAHPDVARFSELPFDAGTAVLGTLEATPFFGMVRFLVVAGMFAPPSRGGNRDGRGWALIGFENAGTYAPPFGAYDAEAARIGEGEPS